MALLNDTLEIRLTSPDYLQDWGVVGNPLSVMLDLQRNAPSVLELTLAPDDPQLQYLLEKGCGVQVKFRGRVEFVGSVYSRRGGALPDAPVTIWAEDETAVLDHALAWPNPGFAFKNPEFSQYTSGKLTPESPQDTAQSFPEPFVRTGHYDWALPFLSPAGPYMSAGGYAWDWNPVYGTGPQTVGMFVGPIVAVNLARLGYSRTQLSVKRANGARYDMNNPYDCGWGCSKMIIVGEHQGGYDWELNKMPPWVDSFPGSEVRFSTLREAVLTFQAWADANDERSFSFEATADVSVAGAPRYLTFAEGPEAYPVELSVASGTVVDGEWSIGDHSASRLILGGPGDMGKRLLQQRNRLDREREGRVIETFKDATGVTLMRSASAEYEEWPSHYFQSDAQQTYKNRATGYFTQSANKLFLETGPETGLSVDLQESESVYYGGDLGYRMGQRVTVDLGWRKFTDRINRVQIELSESNGLTVTPQVGSIEVNDDESRARALKALATRQRQQVAER